MKEFIEVEETALWDRLFHSFVALMEKKCLRGPVASLTWSFLLLPLVDWCRAGVNIFLVGAFSTSVWI